MLLTLLGASATVIAALLPVILKWMEKNATVRNAASLALQRTSLDGLRAIVRKLRGSEGAPPVP